MKFINKIADILVLLLLSFILLVFSVLLYVKFLWPYADYEQIMITIRDTTLEVFLSNAVVLDYVLGGLFFVIAFPLCYFFFSRKQQVCMGILGAILVAYFSGFIDYFVYTRMSSTLYEDEYVDPKKVEYNFPKEKRNLLLIYLESFEEEYSNSKWYEKNLIPNLVNLRNEGQYSREHKPMPGANYSIAALVSSQCAIPLRYSPNRDIWETRFFIPKVTCFPEILKDNGYQTAILKAADIKFTNVNVFAGQHGYDIADGVNEIENNWLKDEIKNHMGTFGGVTDRTLYDYAKIKLSQFDKNKPFMLTLFSLDTHTPGFFLDKKCKKEFGDIRDAFMCSDRAVYEFVDWFKKSPYYDNTTIVIVGDHLLQSRMKGSHKAKRGVFNVFLNVAKGLEIDEEKIFSTYDLAPTILEAMGIELKPRKFGLGASIFDDTATLVERFGAIKLKLNLIKQSNFYDDLIKIDVKRVDKYYPYSVGQEIKVQDFILYTDASEELLGKYYVDRLNIGLENYNGGDLEVLFSFYAIIGGNSDMDIIANNNKLMNYKFDTKEKQPFTIKMNISKELIKDNKLQFKFRNSNSQSTIGLGVSPLTMKIIEK